MVQQRNRCSVSWREISGGNADDEGAAHSLIEKRESDKYVLLILNSAN